MIPIAGRGRRLLLAALVGASLSQAALAAVAAFCVQKVFDTLLSSGADERGYQWIAAVFAGSALAAAAIETYRAWAAEKLGLGYVADLREALFDKIMHAAPSALSQRSHGGLLLPFVGDLTAIKKWVGDGLVRVISAGATSILLLTVLALQSVQLALAAALVVASAAMAVLWLSRPLNVAIRETRARRGAVANFVSSSIKSAQTVQAFDRYPREEQRLRRRSDALMAAGLKLARVSGAMAAVVHLAAAALIAVTLVIGAIEVQRGAMSIGLVAAAISIAGLLAGAVRDLGIAFELWRRAKVSFSKVSRALALRPPVRDADSLRRLPRIGAGLRLDGVGVPGLLEDVTLEARAGSVVNVVGASGSGKSTLLALVARLRDPESGVVKINGRDLRKASLSSTRRSIGIASADTPLMRGSIAMNLRYRSPGASDEEVARVAQVCNLAPILEKFPERDQARIDDGAPDLSLGERQQLLIARAMLDSPAILILDGVDTHLDSATAAQIAAALSEYAGTVLMAATAPALCRVADTIWRIDNRRVAAEPNLHDCAVAPAVETDRRARP